MPANVVRNKSDEKKWEKSKRITRKEKPDLKEGTDEFYAYTMGVFKKMTKKASSNEVAQMLYEEGVLSKMAMDTYKENKDYEGLVENLEKDAKMKDFISDFNKELLPGIGKGILYGSGLALGGLGVVHGTKALSKWKQSLQRDKRLKDIYKFNPSVKEMDKDLVQATMKDIENLNPDYAASPLIAGNILKGVDSWGGFGVDLANMISNKDKRNELVKGLFVAKSPPGTNEGVKQDIKNIKQMFLKTNSVDDKYLNVLRAKPNDNDFFKNILKNPAVQIPLATAALTAIGTGAIKGGGKLLGKAKQAITRKNRINKMIKLYPELAKYDKDNMKRVVKTIDQLNPEFSKNPQIAGSYAKSLLKNFKPKTVEGLSKGASAKELAVNLMKK